MEETDPVTSGSNVSRTQSLAQSCWAGIQSLLFHIITGASQSSLLGTGKWEEKCLCSTCTEELPDVTCQHQRHSMTRLGMFGGVGWWGGYWLTGSQHEWEYHSSREWEKIIMSSMATCVCVSGRFSGECSVYMGTTAQVRVYIPCSQHKMWVCEKTRHTHKCSLPALVCWEPTFCSRRASMPTFFSCVWYVNAKTTSHVAGCCVVFVNPWKHCGREGVSVSTLSHW